MSRSNLISRLEKQSQRPKLYEKAGDPTLLVHIGEVIRNRPTYGYRRVTTLVRNRLLQEGHACVNHKRVYRLMKQHGLLLKRPSHRPKRAHDGKVETLLSNTRWCSDSFTIQCHNGDRVHVAFSIDSCDREVMRYIASTVGIDGQAIRDLMLETVEYRFGEAFCRNCTVAERQWQLLYCKRNSCLWEAVGARY